MLVTFNTGIGVNIYVDDELIGPEYFWEDMVAHNVGLTPGEDDPVDHIVKAETAWGSASGTLSRLLFHWDTTTLPAFAVIHSATLRLNFVGPSPVVGIYKSTAPDVSFSGSDILSFGATQLQTFFSTETGYMNITLNAEAIAGIVKAGYTKFCLRVYNDYAVTDGSSSMEIYNFGSVNPPELVINYSGAYPAMSPVVGPDFYIL